MKELNFKVSGKNVLVEAVLRNDGPTLHFPDGVDAPKDQVDLFVRGVGAEVTAYAPGDRVLVPMSYTYRTEFDAGQGKRKYAFVKEEDVLGKFAE